MSTRRNPGSDRLVAAVALAITTLAACGGGAGTAAKSGGAADGIRLVAHAATRTSAERTARMSFSIVVEGGRNRDDGHIDATGLIDFARQRAEVVVDLSGITAQQPNQVAARVVGSNEYLELGARLGAGKRWVRVDVPAPGAGQSPLGADTFDGGPLGSPDHVLQALQHVATTVDLVGREDVRGAATTHYRADVPFARFIEAEVASLPFHERAAARADLAKIAGVSFPVEVWIDAQGRVRRLRETLTDAMFAGVDPSAATSGATTTVETELWDFGVKVDVSAPPADQTVDQSAVPGLGAATDATPPAPQPSGAWVTVQHGTTKAGAWSIGRASGNQAETACLGFWYAPTATGAPADSDCQGVNLPDDPITLYGIDAFGSDDFVYGGVTTDADQIAVFTESGSRYDAQVHDGTFVAFVPTGDHVDHIQAFSTGHDFGTCLNTDQLGADEAQRIDNPC